MNRTLTPRLITPEALRAVDEEYRDLVTSLRALAALLHDVDAPAPSAETDGEVAEHAWEPVLANILDAELNQLDVLMGDVTVALRMENSVAEPRQTVDLGAMLQRAVARGGSRALVAVAEQVFVAAHADIVAQSIQSALSIAMRIAEGRVVANAKRFGNEGIVTITIQSPDDQGWDRWEPRLQLLNRIVAAEGGRVVVEERGPVMAIRLVFGGATSQAQSATA